MAELSGTRRRARRSSSLRLLFVGALLAMSLVACGSTDAPSETSSTQASPETATVAKVLQFTAPLVGGGEFKGASVAGRPVAFWFWAPT